MNQTSSYSVVNTLTESQIAQLHALYRQTWWSAHRTLPDVRTMLQHSDFIFGVTAPGAKELLAFARVLTDGVYRAVLFDVIVHPDHRSAGLGTFLISHITAHPVISRVEHLSLFCLPELRDFYGRHGFTAELGELIHMRRDTGSSSARESAAPT